MWNDATSSASTIPSSLLWVSCDCSVLKLREMMPHHRPMWFRRHCCECRVTVVSWSCVKWCHIIGQCDSVGIIRCCTHTHRCWWRPSSTHRCIYLQQKTTTHALSMVVLSTLSYSSKLSFSFKKSWSESSHCGMWNSGLEQRNISININKRKQCLVVKVMRWLQIRE